MNSLMPRPTNSELTIASLSAHDVDIPLSENFAISKGALRVARNIFVKITLSDGLCGFGECAPFEAVSGESREATNEALKKIEREIIGRPVSEYRKVARLMNELVPRNPAARCGVETAILDCYCRSLGIPLWKLWSNPEKQTYLTDVTIPISETDESLRLAKHWRKKGFRMLKMKVGKRLDKDINVINQIATALPDVSFVIDANEGFSETDALSLIAELEKSEASIHLIEQPIARDNLEGMARIKDVSPFPICADESVSNVEDVTQIIKANAADVINIKIMKSGVVEALDIAKLAQTGGLGLMFGGMVETRLAMGMSLALASAFWPVHTLDLDTPFLLAEDIVEGGYNYNGPEMTLWEEPGLGLAPKS